MKKLKTMAILIALCLPICVHAEEFSTNANEWSVFKTRTKEEIKSRYETALDAGSYKDGSTSTYYKVAPSLKETYIAGELTSDTHTAMTKMSNYYRYLIGADPLKVTSVHSEELQAGALIRNWDFNHTVDDSKKPSDMDQELWDLGANANHNILAYNYTPRGAITGWLNEGYSLTSQKFDTIGHRQAILSSTRSNLQFGYAGNIAIGLMKESKNESKNPFYAFPAPGYMPNNILSAKSASWTIELNDDYYTANNDVVVVITDLKNDKTYECTKENGKLQVSETMLNFAQPSASANAGMYSGDDAYKVEVKNLQTKTRAISNVEYTVNFFDVLAKEEKEEETTNQNQNQTTTEEVNTGSSQNTTNNVTELKATTENTVTEENPQTGDKIGLMVGLLLVSVVASLFSIKGLAKSKM